MDSHYERVTKHWPQFIILDGRKHGDTEYPDLFVSTRLEKFGGIAQFSSHAFVQHEGPNNILETGADPATIPTLRQFVDFANTLRAGKAYDERGKLLEDKTCKDIFEGTLMGTALVGEFLNGEFIYKGRKFPFGKRKVCLRAHELKENVQRFTVDRKRITISSELSEIIEELRSYSDRPDRIDLIDWLERATPQGLPPKKVKSGDLMYRPPIGFGSTILYMQALDRGLNCSIDGYSQSPFVGLRKVMLKS